VRAMDDVRLTMMLEPADCLSNRSVSTSERCGGGASAHTELIVAALR
jgi:hypothetical protein